MTYKYISMNEFSRNELMYISNDIQSINNPIRKFNDYFNNSWNNNFETIYNFYDNMGTKLIDIMHHTNDIFINNIVKKYSWSNIIHDLPYVYQEYIKKNTKISYEKFTEIFYTRKINLITKYDEYFINIPSIIRSIFNVFEQGNFNDLDIRLYVENNINRCDFYTFESLDMYFFYSENSDQRQNIIKHIYIISKWIHEFKPEQKIKIYYFDTPLKKCIDYEQKFLSSRNVNSGSSLSNNYIMIWRREELLKVLIHELIHYLNLDVKHDNNFNNIIKNNFGNIKFPILINETITELQAQLLHSIYISMINGEKRFGCFKTIYNYELIYSWYQYAKIMTFYEIKQYSVDNLINKFNQTSNVFAYYILKCILSLNFHNIFKLNHFQKHTKQQDGLCDVNSCNILINYIKNIYVESHNKYNILLNEMINLKSTNKSLRMTIFGAY